ncbi:hypothetical protein SDC9_121761 [bioreactor metagenome]|uniref:Uncharacterized protein n=1 Tax=bioreactor metagenome TaxID=1076179 RepID=A0A645CD20_9ZZZZ
MNANAFRHHLKRKISVCNVLFNIALGSNNVFMLNLVLIRFKQQNQLIAILHHKLGSLILIQTKAQFCTNRRNCCQQWIVSAGFKCEQLVN